MSAFYSFASKECVQIITDAAVCDHDGIVRMLCDKVARSGRLPVAMTGRGAFEDWHRTIIELMAFDAEPTVEAMLNGIRGKLRQMKLAGDGRKTEILIAVASPIDGCSHHFVAFNDMYPEIRPFELKRMPEQFGMGPPITRDDLPEELHEWIGKPMFPLLAAKSIIEAMRRKAWVAHPGYGSDRPLHWIGGGAQRTVVSLQGCMAMGCHVWPEDRVGEPIRPRALPV